MKRNLLLLLLLSLSKIAFSQNQDKIKDSLILALKASGEDTSKVNVLNALSETFWRKYKYQISLDYANNALALSQKINFKKGASIAYNNMGTVFARQENYDIALKNYLTALKISTEIKFKTGIITANDNIGSLYAKQKDYTLALRYYSENLKIAIGSNNKKIIGSTYLAMGYIYANEDNFPNALKNYLTALKIFEEIDQKRGIADTYDAIGFVYYNQGNLLEALNNCSNSLKIAEEINYKETIALAHSNIAILYSERGDNLEAIKHLLVALKIQELLGNKEGEVLSYNNLANCNMRLKKNAEAENYIRKCLLLAEEIGDKRSVAMAYSTYGVLYMQMRKLSEARNYLNKSLILSKELGLSFFVRNCYSDLSRLDSLAGDFKSSNQYLWLYSKMRDSIVSEKSNKLISQLKIQYETEKKNKEIALLNSENKIKTTEVEKQRIIQRMTFLFAAIAILMVLLLLNNYRIKNKTRQLTKANEIRLTISRDLHDEIGAGLTSISMACEQGKISSGKEKNEITFYDRISSKSRSLSENLSEVVWATNPENDNLPSLLSYMRNYVSKFFEDSSIDYSIRFPEQIPNLFLEPNVSRNLFFVLKEALNNCAKHSDASYIEILFQLDGDKNYIFQVNDNGKGINEQAMPSNHNGFNYMKRRIEEIKGKFDIKSEKGKGTYLDIRGCLV